MARPLCGHLDDVDLDEVLRVIALSRRCGQLDIDAESRAELHFVGGRLVRARLHESRETLGALLVRVGVLNASDLLGRTDSETLEEVVRRAELVRLDAHLLVKVDDVIAEQLAAALRRVLQQRQGSFSFRLTPDAVPPRRYASDTAFTLPSGIDAEEVAREAKRRRSDRKSDAPASLPPQRPTRSPNKEVVVVDDDPAFLAGVERTLGEAGVPVQTLTSAREVISKLGALFAQGLRALVVDLVMPRSNGRGILGGLEVLRAAQRLGHADRVFLAFDDVHGDAAALALALGAAGVLVKPPDSEGLPSFWNPVLLQLDRPPLVAAGFDLAKELQHELREHRDEWTTAGRRSLDDATHSLATLKALLGELNSPSFDEEIPLLILRFTSAFFVRGALFTVHRHLPVEENGGVEHGTDELLGLGGFGFGGNDPGRLVRSIRLPLEADTVFTRAIAERCGVRQPLWESPWNTRLLTTLGGPHPREVYTAPLLSPQGIECVLYADNATEPRPFPDIALLEIFLQQAAAAMERATLSRELSTLRASQPPRSI